MLLKFFDDRAFSSFSTANLIFVGTTEFLALNCMRKRSSDTFEYLLKNS